MFNLWKLSCFQHRFTGMDPAVCSALLDFFHADSTEAGTVLYFKKNQTRKRHGALKIRRPTLHWWIHLSRWNNLFGLLVVSIAGVPKDMSLLCETFALRVRLTLHYTVICLYTSNSGRLILDCAHVHHCIPHHLQTMANVPNTENTLVFMLQTSQDRFNMPQTQQAASLIWELLEVAPLTTALSERAGEVEASGIDASFQWLGSMIQSKLSMEPAWSN